MWVADLLGLAIAYRLRGSGLLGNVLGRIVWAGSIMWATLSGWAALGAFAGLWIPHGHVYQCDSWAKRVEFYLISFVRLLLMGCGWASIPGAAAIVAAYWAGHKLYPRIQDPLKFAEPVTGALVGVCLVTM